jgi:hypothetical protein
MALASHPRLSAKIRGRQNFDVNPLQQEFPPNSARKTNKSKGLVTENNLPQSAY